MHGCVPGPCLRRARWILQRSPKQLLSQSSVEPITSHWHVFWPFMVPQAYGKHYISLIGMYKRSNAFRAPGRRGRGPSSGAQASRPYQLRWCSGGSQAAVPSEPLGRRGRGPSPRALALTMLTLGPRRSGLRKRARTPEFCEDVVSTYIQNCQLFVYSEVVSTYIQNCQLFVYVGASRRTYRIVNCLCTWERLDVHTELPIVCVRGWVYVTIAKNKSIRPPCCSS